MTRLKKELIARGIVFEASDWDVMRGPEYDQDRRLVEVTDKFIITAYFSAVIPPELQLFDRFTFKFIGGQNLRPETCFGRCYTKWDSYVEGSEDTID